MILQVVTIRKKSAVTMSILVFVLELGSLENLVWVAWSRALCKGWPVQLYRTHEVRIYPRRPPVVTVS